MKFFYEEAIIFRLEILFQFITWISFGFVIVYDASPKHTLKDHSNLYHTI